MAAAKTASKKTAAKSIATKKSSAAETQKKHPVELRTDRSWYDYPEYYDAGFVEGLEYEANFFEQAFKKYVPHEVKRVFEPGCGSGRLIVEMARRGYDVTGLDLSTPMLDYCRAALKKHKLKATLIQDDMTTFKLSEKVDAAFNTINTFRHLLTEQDAIAHLKAIANCLNTGGIYILGLHLLPDDGDLYGTEKWQAKHDDARIYYTLTVAESDEETRVEKLRMTMLVKRPTESFKLIDHLHLRVYDAKNLKSLIKKVPELKLRNVFDFWYDIEHPLKLDNEICDTVLVLQKV